MANFPEREFPMLRSLFTLALAVLFMSFTAPSATAADNSFTSTSFHASPGTNRIEVDVSGTTCTTWKVQRQKTDGSWENVESGENSTTADPFTITSDNSLTGDTYRVIGNTSATSGPYSATATPK